MLNSTKSKFVCEWTGNETDVRHYVPSESTRAKPKGCFMDANCVVASLSQTKPRGWKKSIALVEKLAGKRVITAPKNTWSETSEGRVANVKGMTQTVDEFLAKKRKLSDAFPASFRKKQKKDVTQDNRRREALQIPLPAPVPRVERVKHQYQLVIVEDGKRRVHFTDNWRAYMRDELRFETAHAMPVIAASDSEFTLYPLLCCDPKHVRASPVSVTVKISTDVEKIE